MTVRPLAPVAGERINCRTALYEEATFLKMLSAVFARAMPKVAIHIVVAVLACSVASSFALADERALNVGCHFSGENMVSLDITLIQNLELPSDKALDLMVSDVIFEVHSESGGFWIQLEQPVLLNLKFELCEILQSEGIKFEETNVGRFLVEGMAISTDEPVELWGRCKNFPLPLCDSPE